MTGIDVPISFTVVGKSEVQSALKSIVSELDKLAQTKNKTAVRESVTKSLFPSGSGVDSLGDNKELRNLVSQAQKRVLNAESLAKLQQFSQSKDFESNAALSALVAKQQSPLASFIRQADAAGLGVQNSKGELNTKNLAKAVKDNITSLLERGRLTSKQLAEIEKLIEKGDFEKLAQKLQYHESKQTNATKIKEDVKKAASNAINNVTALTNVANAAGTAAQQVQTQLNNATSPQNFGTNPAAWAAQAAAALANTQAVPTAATGGMGTGGGGTAGGLGGGGIGGMTGVPGAPDPIDEYLSALSRRFSTISTSFLKVNEVARGSLRSLTPQSVENFLNQFGTTLEEFRTETAKILEQEGAQIGMTPAENAALGQMIFGTSRTLSGPEFANLNEAEIAQQARLLGAGDIATAFPNMTDEQREKALRIFTTQVAQTTKAYKLLAETVENINVKLGQLNREEANVIISRIRTERNPELAQQAMEQLNRRRVIFAGQDLQYRESEYGNLSPAELASLSPSVANDIEENRNSVKRNANQALGAPRTAFEQLATLGGRIAAIFSLIQFTVGTTIQTLQQFLEQANRLEKVSATVNALSGNFDTYSKSLTLAATQQRKFGGTLEENLQGLSSLIPVSKRYNADLQQLDNIARRLAIVDPLQGFSGAAIALKEFFSGDITSLSRRFEIDRATLNSIKEAGDKTAQLQKLDQVLNDLGISNEVLNARTKTSAATFDKFGATISNITTAFGAFIQDALRPTVEQLDNFLSVFNSTITFVENNRAINLDISSNFAKLAPTVNSIINLQNQVANNTELLSNKDSQLSQKFVDNADNRAQKLKEIAQLQNQLTREVSSTTLEVNNLIRQFNEANNVQAQFITDKETAVQFAKAASTGDVNALVRGLREPNILGIPRYESANRADQSLNNLLGNITGFKSPLTPFVLQGDRGGTQAQLSILADLLDQIIEKRSQLDRVGQEALVRDVADANNAFVYANLSAKEFIDLLIQINDKSYTFGQSTIVISDALNALSEAQKRQAANLAALNKPILSTEVSLEIVKGTIEQINEFTKKQTQTQLEQYALAQRLGDQYSEQAKAKNDEFKANRQLLASDEFDRNDYLAKFGQSITLQARLALEQEKSIGIIGLMRDGLLGYNVTLTEAVGLAKELQNSFRGLATGSLLSALPVGQQLQFQQGVLSGSGPFAARNQNEAFGAVTNIIGLEMKRSDMQRQVGQRLTDIAKDDADKRQKLQEDYNKDLLKMQEDYEKRKLELLKKSEVDKRQGKVDFYSSLMNADNLTPEQQKMLSGKYETLFGQVSELRNQGQFDKATAVLEAGTTQITNEMNYLQEVANQKENIKEADKDIAKLQEDYNKADSADSRKSILDKIEQRRQDKDTAENRIKQLDEIRTLQTDADNERVKTATEAEDKITDDYNKQVDERKKAYLDALKEQDAAYKKSVDDAKKQSQELYDQNITSLNFLTALGVFSETIPNLFKQMLSAGRDPEGLDRIDAKISEAERTLLEATPATLRPTISALITTLEKLNAGPSQTQINPEDPLPTALDKVATSTDELKTSIDVLNSTLKTYMAGGYYR
jgi:hypothetical protein